MTVLAAVVVAAVVVVFLGWRGSLVAVEWIRARTERDTAREQALVGVGEAVAAAVGEAVASMGAVFSPPDVVQQPPAPGVEHGSEDELGEAVTVLRDWSDEVFPQEDVDRVVGEWLPSPPVEEPGW